MTSSTSVTVNTVIRLRSCAARAEHSRRPDGAAVTQAERVWSAYIDAWNTHHIDSIIAAVDEQFIYDERPMTMATPLRGREAFRKYLEGVFKIFPDLHIETVLCDTGAAVGVAESLMRGTFAGPMPLARGRRISARVACDARRRWPSRTD